MMSSDEVINHRKLLTIYRRNLSHYLTQLAELGILVPPSVIHGIAEARENIRRIKDILRADGHVVPDHRDDETPTYHFSFVSTCL